MHVEELKEVQQGQVQGVLLGLKQSYRGATKTGRGHLSYDERLRGDGLI